MSLKFPQLLDHVDILSTIEASQLLYTTLARGHVPLYCSSFHNLLPHTQLCRSYDPPDCALPFSQKLIASALRPSFPSIYFSTRT